MPITVERTLVIEQSPGAVIEYLEDFAHTEEWDPGTVRCTRLDPGPVLVGSRWRNVSRFRGRETVLEYALVRRDPGRLVFRGENRTVVAVDDLTIDAHDQGCRLVYRAELTFKGLAALVAPLLRRSFEELADQVEQQLPSVLARL
jgi:carbon monoxide dehydrogenase subunit G